VRGFADFYHRFFGETPSQKTPDIGLTSIRVAKLGNAYTGHPPPRNRSSMLRSAYPPGGTPSISLIPPKALVVVDAGLGTIIDDKGMFWHNGGNVGFRSLYVGCLVSGNGMAAWIPAHL
jgi:hypothetical protein